MLAAIAIVVATVIASSRWLSIDLSDLNFFAYAGLAVACWIGAGGALVPVPGVRPISWIMIVQQGATLDPIVVALLASASMALGQTSIFVAAHASAYHHSFRHRDGHSSRPHKHSFRSHRGARRIAGWAEEAEGIVKRLMGGHPGLTVFMVSLIPNPLTTFASMTAGATGVGFRRFLGASVSAFLIFSSLLVLLGGGLLAVFGLSAA